VRALQHGAAFISCDYVGHWEISWERGLSELRLQLCVLERETLTCWTCTFFVVF